MISITERTLVKSLKLHLYHDASELARLLSEHHSVFSVKKNKAEYYYELAIKCNMSLMAWIETSVCFTCLWHS